MRSALSEYGYLSAKLKTRTSTLLDDDIILKLARARTVQEAFISLRGTAYEDLERVYAATGDLKAVEAELFAREAGAYSELLPRLEGPTRAFIAALARRPELDAVKDALRLWFDSHVRGRHIGDRTGYRFAGRVVDRLDFDAIVNAASPAELALAFRGSAYGSIVAKHAQDTARLASLYALESALDAFYFSNLESSLAGLRPADRRLARRFVAFDADIQNLNSLVRSRLAAGPAADQLKRQLIAFPGAVKTDALENALASDKPLDRASAMFHGSIRGLEAFWARADSRGRLGGLERFVRQAKTDEARALKGKNPFSIGVILSYLELRCDELRRLRSALNAAHYGLPEDRARSVI
ncbi:MAG TPA: V-type ATPase subunit [Spirochaetales bacterium]|nr:V-type ATPase subunit [Spirochaetales bacterium]MBP7262740.1 V-type ATPase subunit [Spirochaetia bacterium]HPE36328.1 V-type ATPase subunit [Spirochaetales bacterium]